MEQAQRARAFAELHKPGQPLLLPNAWDVASAVAIAGAGAKAIATTSAGVAWSLGVPDGAGLGADRAAAVIARMMAWPGAPAVAELAAAGAVRISLGSAIAQAAYAVAARAATELLTSGTYDSVAGGIAYDTMNDAITATPRGLPRGWSAGLAFPWGPRLVILPRCGANEP